MLFVTTRSQFLRECADEQAIRLAGAHVVGNEPLSERLTTVTVVPAYAPPVLNEKKFNCPHCNAFAQQEWTDMATPADDQYDWVFYADPDGSKNGAQWRGARCGACDQSSMWLEARMVYPAGSTLPSAHEDMPKDVAVLYEEARAVAGVSRRAGAAMARATLELLLRTVLPEQTTVPPKAQLDDLVLLVEPLVSAAMATPLMVVRHAGNKSVHVEEQPDDVMVLVLDEAETEVMELIFITINDLVSELITRPKMIEKYAALIPEGVKEAAEKKRAKRAAEGA